MDRIKTVKHLEKLGVIAVVRVDNNSKVLSIIDALCEGGVNAIEITMTTPRAESLIDNIASQYNDKVLIGAGSVLDSETARAVILAGARFIVSPILNIETIHIAHHYDVVAIPGAFTPTEILRAWENGADIVKIFPATAMGPQYFRDIHAPLPYVKLTPTGGVSLENTAAFIKSGASCVGVGSALVSKEIINSSDWSGLTKRAIAFRAAVEEGRNVIN